MDLIKTRIAQICDGDNPEWRSYTVEFLLGLKELLDYEKEEF